MERSLLSSGSLTSFNSLLSLLLICRLGSWLGRGLRLPINAHGSPRVYVGPVVFDDVDTLPRSFGQAFLTPTLSKFE